MAILMEILLRLTDVFCWLCTKRGNIERRLMTEDLIRRQRDSWGKDKK